jgi:hypothetical protein
MSTLLLILVVVLAIGLGLIIYGTIAKTRWGINFQPLSCPSCGTPVAQIRKPASGQEALWGGYTCQKCGCRMDKWGRQRPA